MITKVYKYGLLPPTTNAPLILEQLRLARQYQNKLVEIELTRRFSYRSIMETHNLSAPIAARIAAVTELVEATVTKMQAAKRRDHKGASAVLAADRETLKSLKALLASERLELKEAKAHVKEDPAIQEAIDSSNERASLAVKEVRATMGLFWGTYLVIERAMQAARKEKDEPNFRRWDGTGILGMQLQKGISVERLFGADRRVQIGAETKYTTVKLRVGSEGRDPIWGEWPLKLHRPIPKDARVTWVTVTRRFHGTIAKWELHVTVDLPDTHVTEPCGAAGTGAVAVDIGWRKREGDLRVGQYLDEKEAGAEILCPADITSGLDKADSLRSIRDRNFDAYLPALVSFIAGGGHPADFLERTKTAHAWKAPRRLVALRTFWAQNRWAGDEEAFAGLEAFCKQDRHLFDWEANQRRKTLARRREGYKVLAAELARTHEILVIEKFDLRDTAKKPEVESEDPNIKQYRIQQRQVASSELRAALVGAFRARGGQVFEAPAAYTTRECSACGNLEPWDQEKELVHVCTECGEMWDQDENACRNLLRLYRERRGAFLVKKQKINRFAGKGKKKKGTARKGVQETKDLEGVENGL